MVSASGSRAPSPGAPRSAGRRAAPQSSPPKPEWVDDLSEPAREVVSQQDYDSKPIGRSRAGAPAAAAAKPSPAPALDIPFGEAEEVDPWCVLERPSERNQGAPKACLNRAPHHSL